MQSKDKAMNDLDQALAEISVIRSQMSRSIEFRGVGPVTVALTGALALVAAKLQSVWLPDPRGSLALYLVLWVTTAALSIVLIGFETVTRSRRVHSGLAQEMILTAVEQFLPALAAGVLVTATLLLAAPDHLAILPGLWQIFFSLGIFASLRFLPRSIFAVGLWYLATGLTCVAFAQGDWAFLPWAMGIPFGLGQFLGAGLLQLHAASQ